MHHPVVILGAGLTGLGAARHLPGSVIYEAKDHVGGPVYSHEQGGIHFNEGSEGVNYEKRACPPLEGNTRKGNKGSR